MKWRRQERRRPVRTTVITESSPPAEPFRARRSPAERETEQPAARSPKPSRRRDWSWLQRIGLVIVSLAVLASAVNILSLSGQVKIVNLNRDSQLARPASTYAQAATQVLSRSVWNRNKITVRTADVSRQLLVQFPELDAVTITVPLLAHQPDIYLTPAQPSLILSAAGGAFLIGDTGKAILGAATPAALNQPALPVLTDQTGFKPQLNHQALPAADVRFIDTVIAQLAAKQYKVSDLSLLAGGSELDAHVTGQPYLIKFNLHGDATGEAGTFLATANYLRQHNQTPASYIDVRVEGRAYYK